MPACKAQDVQRFSALAAGTRVQGRQRAVVPGVERLQQIPGLAAANLSEDDPVRAVPQRRSDQVPHRHLRCPTCLPSRFKPNQIWMLQLQFHRVFDRQDALASRYQARNRR